MLDGRSMGVEHRARTRGPHPIVQVQNQKKMDYLLNSYFFTSYPDNKDKDYASADHVGEASQDRYPSPDHRLIGSHHAHCV